MRTRLTALAATAAVLVAGPALAQDFSLEPTFGTLNLMTGYVPDPAVIPLIAGGDIDASGLGETCNGFISNPPDFRVNYEAGTDFPLIISAVSDADTTLVVNGADGSWHCNDDHDGLNPAVTFTSPQSGQYDIWVGIYGEATTAPAGLYISEIVTGSEAMGTSGEH
ncbi:MAG: peptidase S1 [Caulobacterales bacterium]|nr:peptidase S1 [Caulobacterales bacterium]